MVSGGGVVEDALDLAESRLRNACVAAQEADLSRHIVDDHGSAVSLGGVDDAPLLKAMAPRLRATSCLGSTHGPTVAGQSRLFVRSYVVERPTQVTIRYVSKPRI